jgi:tetratricopeptide (TPR) repeat protein/GTPase SAR1 family protein
MGILDRIAGTLDDLVAGDDAQSETRAREELALARAFIERGDLAEAAARIEEVAGRHPRLAAVFVARGELANRRRNDDDAATAFGRAVDLDASDAEAWLQLGQVLARLQRFEPARDALRRALTQTLAPERRAQAQAALGRLYARAGQRGKAIRELRKAVELLPDDAEVLATLGRALVASGEAEGADWLARAARLPDGDARLLVEAADAKASGAERLLDEAAERAPGDAVVRSARARHFLAQGDGAAALSEAVAATALVPRWPGAWRTLGEVRAAAGDFAEALNCARREAELGAAPPFPIWLAYALGTGDRDAITEALKHGDASAPGFSEAQTLIAGTLDRAGVIALAQLAPSAAARRFVVRALAPPPAPAGNLVALLAWAEALAEHQPSLVSLAVPMARAVEAFDRPLLIAVMGEFNAGKSSLVNALAGDVIAPVGVTPTTATINVLRFGPRGGRVSYHDGTTRELGAATVGPFLAGLGDREAATVRQVEVFAPLEALRRVEIVDTPGLNSLRPEHEKVARDFLVDADALIWVFAAGQAAKATEREALRLAHAAGKRVLGVINKIDRAEPDELTAIVRHVETTLGDLVEGVIPLSAQAALAARQQGGAPGGGLDALEARLDSTFFARARELKRATAVAALRRFLAESATLTATGDGGGSPTDAARQALRGAHDRLQSALAAERVTLRARLNEGFRMAASEVREFIRPRAWLFGEHRADPADEAFLADILDDATLRATAATRAALVTAIAPPDAPAAPRGSELLAAVDDAIERFRAYARGITEGAATVFFRVDLPRIRLDLGAIHAGLARWLPEPDEYLFRTIERAVRAIAERAEKDLDTEARAREIAELMRNEHLVQPLHGLTRAVDALTTATGEAPS